ncbi:MAG: TIGR04197 family type VII secretion effector [Suipraeoptans sp.]
MAKLRSSITAAALAAGSISAAGGAAGSLKSISASSGTNVSVDSAFQTTHAKGVSVARTYGGTVKRDAGNISALAVAFSNLDSSIGEKNKKG